MPLLLHTASSATPTCHDDEVRELLRQQILVWRKESKSWTWIKKQPAGVAYYQVLNGK